MPLARDPRADRRRRVLLERQTCDKNSESENRRGKRGRNEETTTKDSGPKTGHARRGAGYSQDVRQACGIRLVQLIPVRKRTYWLVILASMLLPASLLAVHYMVYVNGMLPWYGHPLALMVDASHPRGLAAWLGSHLWFLCMIATILTFQLRKHKLDDYNGEYRLWFWLVLTCLIGSVDSSTHVTQLFGMALDRWSLLNLGWSGSAVVQATLAALVGMLGLRLCSELKAAPSSLLFWLSGLVGWAGAAALGQEELQLSFTIQFRIWLASALWLGGLTLIWLAALAYLRYVYIEAQRRFLARRHIGTAQGMPIRQRIAQKLPTLPSVGPLASLSRLAPSGGQQPNPDRSDESYQPKLTERITGWIRQPKDTDDPPEFKKVGKHVTNQKKAEQQGQARRAESESGPHNQQSAAQPSSDSSSSTEKGDPHPPSAKSQSANNWFPKPKLPKVGWPGMKLPSRKTKSEDNSSSAGSPASSSKAANAPAEQRTQDAQADEEKANKRFRLGIPKIALPKVPKVKLPKMNLPSIRLKPPQPQSTTSDEPGETSKPLQPVGPKGGKPSTSGDNSGQPSRTKNSTRGDETNPTPHGSADQNDAQQHSNRPLTKAERKRMKRMQQNTRNAA